MLKEIWGTIPLLYKISLLLAILACGGLWFWSALSDAYDRGENACKAEYAQKQITVMEKRHEIARNRPDDGATVKRLRAGTF